MGNLTEILILKSTEANGLSCLRIASPIPNFHFLVLLSTITNPPLTFRMVGGNE